MDCWKRSYKIVIEGDQFSFTAYDEENKNVILMYENNAQSFDKLLDFIYHTINGQTDLRKEHH